MTVGIIYLSIIKAVDFEVVLVAALYFIPRNEAVELFACCILSISFFRVDILILLAVRPIAEETFIALEVDIIRVYVWKTDPNCSLDQVLSNIIHFVLFFF